MLKSNKHSMASMDSNLGKELPESISSKIIALKWVVLSLFANSILLWLIASLSSDAGLTVTLGNTVFESAGPMLLQLWMHVSHESTIMAIDSGLGAFLGYLISTPKG